MRLAPLFAAAIVAIAAPASAQHDHTSPYAGQHSGIASLSEQELADLLAGAGMGLARAAELNHYPGPKHVLELADSLGLTADQRAKITALRDAMSAEAIRLGQQIVEQERVLSQRFEHTHIDEATLRTMTDEIAALQGRLRFTHLAAHIQTRAILEDRQVAAYDRLRGYVAGTMQPNR